MSSFISCISRSALTVALALFALPTVSAQSIYKCVDGETVAYQSMPCGNGQTEMRLMTVARAAPADVQAVPVTSIPRVDRSEPTPVVRGGAWPFRRTLMLGMSDDEVLNLQGWGVPKRITRERKAQQWREEWTYGSPINGERRLYFVNAALVDVVDAPTSQHVASLTIQ